MTAMILSNPKQTKKTVNFGYLSMTWQFFFFQRKEVSLPCRKSFNFAHKVRAQCVKSAVLMKSEISFFFMFYEANVECLARRLQSQCLACVDFSIEIVWNFVTVGDRCWIMSHTCILLNRRLFDRRTRKLNRIHISYVYCSTTRIWMQSKWKMKTMNHLSVSHISFGYCFWQLNQNQLVTIIIVIKRSNHVHWQI